MNENLKIETLIPESISEISYANEESDFGGYSVAHHRSDKAQDYQIKVNGPEGKDLKDIDSGFDTSKQIHNQDPTFIPLAKACLGVQGSPHPRDENILPKPQKIEYKDRVTGYEVNKQCFSEEQMLKAFRILDINKDDMITEEDLIFVLDYMKESYTQEQVKEMINMLSSDRKHVSFKQFKELGKGYILPLASFKMPTPETKLKQQILENVQQYGLLDEDPEQILECLRSGSISFARYEEFKNKVKSNSSNSQMINRQIAFSKFIKQLPLKSTEQFKSRRQSFLECSVAKPKDIRKNQLGRKYLPISPLQIASILQISLKEVNQLYPSAEEHPVPELEVLIEAVAFSRERILDKLDICLQLINDEPSIQFCEAVHILQILKGRDESTQKKFKAVCKARGLPIHPHAEVNKTEMMDIIGSHLSVFFY